MNKTVYFSPSIELFQLHAEGNFCVSGLNDKKNPDNPVVNPDDFDID